MKLNDYKLYKINYSFWLTAAIRKDEPNMHDACLDIILKHIKDILEWNPPTITSLPVDESEDLPVGWSDEVFPYTVHEDSERPEILREATILDFFLAEKEAKLTATDSVKSLVDRIIQLEKQVALLSKKE